MWVHVCTLLALAAPPPLVPLAAPKAKVAVVERAPLAPSLAEVSDLVARHRPTLALARLTRVIPILQTTARARFLRAEALYQARRWPEARKAFEDVLLHGPILVDRVRFHLGDTLHRLGQSRAAAAVLARVPTDSRYHQKALFLRANALLDAGRPAAVHALLVGWRDTPGKPAAAEALFLLGRADAALPHPDDAASAFRTVVLSHPASPFASQAALRLALSTRSKRLSRAWATLARALARRRTAHALALVEGGRRVRPLEAELHFVRARLARRAGHAHQAMVLFARAAALGKREGDTDLVARAAFAFASLIEDTGRLAGASRVFAKMAGRHPDHPLAPRALMTAARLSLRLGRNAEAARRLKSFLLLYPIDPSRPRALFLMGWAKLRQKRYRRAAEFFATAAREAPARAARETQPGASRVTAAARALYWSARSLGLAGDAKAAAAGYRGILSRYPLSYYAALARAHLEGDADVALLPTSDAHAPDLATARRVRRAADAASLGWISSARAELAPLLAHPSIAKDGTELIAAADLLARLGGTGAARALYREAVMRHPGDLSPAVRERAFHLAFPRPYAAIIAREAKRHGFSPWLLDGLVLRESGFRACARSRVGAQGLTQLMIPAARDAARDLRLPRPTHWRLCNPAYNLRLGAWHLTKLLRHYHGSRVLALAAYNGGPGAVDRWLRKRGGLPIDAFVEEIPFDETRTYVRTVMSAARAYAWIYGRPGTGGLHTDLRLGAAGNADAPPVRTLLTASP